MKKLFLLLIYCVITLSGFAQLHNTEVLIFVPEENVNLGKSSWLNIYRIIDGELKQYSGIFGQKFHNVRDLSGQLKKDYWYLENNSKIWHTYPKFEYSREISNEKWHVYGQFIPGAVAGEYSWPDHTQYTAISKDLNECMIWKEPDWDKTGISKLKRVSKKAISNYAPSRDFLK